MTDPFQNVDAAGEDFIQMFADAMDVRQSDPVMEEIVVDYLDRLGLAGAKSVIEVGAGAGAVSRRIAAQVGHAQVTGYEPSAGFVAEAEKRAKGLDNLRFVQADGGSLPLDDASVDAVVMHTVLSHVTDPEALIAEAVRVLRPGGGLAICDADFAKASMAGFPNDPLDACARAFVSDLVTDAYLVGKLRPMMASAGLSVEHFGLRNRLITTPQPMLPWVQVTTQAMVQRGEIGQQLADALLAECHRRGDEGTFYGFQVMASAIGRKG